MDALRKRNVENLSRGGKLTGRGSMEAPHSRDDRGLLISIITATYNAASELAVTARSIRDQTYPRIQWIVIDGGSRDGTVDEIRRNEDIVSYWQSEKDRGIYDAWNKGCSEIEGDWVLFLGAGDELAGCDVIEKCVSHLERAGDAHEIVYGKIALISEDGTALCEIGEPWAALKGKWGGLLPLLPPHPSSFHRGEMFKGRNPFDTRFRFAGDSDFVARSVLRADPLFIPLLVDRMLAGGVSARSSNTLRLARERRFIASGLHVKAPILHAVRWHMAVAFRLAVLVLPQGVRRQVARWVRSPSREQAPGRS